MATLARKSSSSPFGSAVSDAKIKIGVAGSPALEATRVPPYSLARSRRERRRRAEARLRLLLVRDGVALASHLCGPHQVTPAFPPRLAAAFPSRPPKPPPAAEAWHSIPVLPSDVKYPLTQAAVPPILVLDPSLPLLYPERSPLSCHPALPCLLFVLAQRPGGPK